MEQIAESHIAETLLSAPGWARVGLTAPDKRMREQAAQELARCLVGEQRQDDPRQLALLL